MITELIIIAVIILLITVYFVAKHVAKKRRLSRPMSIYLTEDYINDKATNLDVFSNYDERLLKKYESLAVWIKLRERYGKRLISYMPVNPKEAERTHRGKSDFGYPVYVKYISDDGRTLTDIMYIHNFCLYDMALVTNDEYEKLKKGEPCEFSVTASELRAMKERFKDTAVLSDEDCRLRVIREKERLLTLNQKE